MSQSQSPLKRQDAMKDLGMTINPSITHPASNPAPTEHAPQPIEVDSNGNRKNGGRRRKSNKRKSQKSHKSQKKRSNKKSAKKKSVKRR